MTSHSDQPTGDGRRAANRAHDPMTCPCCTAHAVRAAERARYTEGLVAAGRCLASALEEVAAVTDSPRTGAQIERTRDAALVRWVVAVVDWRKSERGAPETE